MGDISVAIFLWRYFFFATCFRQIIFICAKNIFSSHLATMAIGSANPVSTNGLIQIVMRLARLANGKPRRCYYTCDHMIFMKWVISLNNMTVM